MDTKQGEKARAFRALHERKRAFIIPNPWDAGSAKLLAHLGFEALATTSAGYAFSMGRPDNTTSRAEMLAHCSAVVMATELPVSGDLERRDWWAVLSKILPERPPSPYTNLDMRWIGWLQLWLLLGPCRFRLL